MTTPDVTVAEAREAGLAVPSDSVPALVDELGLSATAEAIALDRCRKFQFSEAASGKDPDGIAAAAVYIGGLLTDDDVTQDIVADAAGISAATIRELYPVLVTAAWDDDVEPILFKSDVERVVSLPEDAASHAQPELEPEESG
jgi:transcription initiation factor TFIIIB Brf1 subunit/transcription initiation factor TFIIB